MTQHVAIDPAARRFAWAVARDGVLTACAYGTSFEDIAIDPALPTSWIFEVPQRYRTHAAAHRNLDALDRTVQRLFERARPYGHLADFVRPSEWKGNVPKVIHHQRIAALLAPVERVLLPDVPQVDMSYAHDVHDAVALLLYHINRAGRGGRKP